MSKEFSLSLNFSLLHLRYDVLLSYLHDECRHGDMNSFFLVFSSCVVHCFKWNREIFRISRTHKSAQFHSKCFQVCIQSFVCIDFYFNLTLPRFL